MKHRIKFSKKYLKENLITKRAKVLYVICCFFQIRIKMPNFECKAQREKLIKEQFYKSFGEMFVKGFYAGLEE